MIQCLLEKRWAFMAVVEWKVTEGLTGYPESLEFMEQRVELIEKCDAPELVWLLEYPPLYTAGTSAKSDDLLYSIFPVFNAGRGGQYTYHGPGQRVVYVLLSLKARKMCDIRLYLKKLSYWVINALRDLSVTGRMCEERIGIWVKDGGEEKKIAAFGIRVRRWVTYHGVAINVSPNLSHYQGIVPCGLSGYGVTSLRELGVNVSLMQIDDILKREFCKIFTVD